MLNLIVSSIYLTVLIIHHFLFSLYLIVHSLLTTMFKHLIIQNLIFIFLLSIQIHPHCPLSSYSFIQMFIQILILSFLDHFLIFPLIFSMITFRYLISINCSLIHESHSINCCFSISINHNLQCVHNFNQFIFLENHIILLYLKIGFPNLNIIIILNSILILFNQAFIIIFQSHYSKQPKYNLNIYFFIFYLKFPILSLIFSFSIILNLLI